MNLYLGSALAGHSTTGDSLLALGLGLVVGFVLFY